MAALSQNALDPKTFPTFFAEALTRERERERISVKEMANRAHVPRATYEMWEQGTEVPGEIEWKRVTGSLRRLQCLKPLYIEYRNQVKEERRSLPNTPAPQDEVQKEAPVAEAPVEEKKEEELPPLPENFGKAIQAERIRTNLTLTELGELMSLSRMAVHHWESGRAIPSWKSLEELFKLFPRLKTLPLSREQTLITGTAPVSAPVAPPVVIEDKPEETDAPEDTDIPEALLAVTYEAPPSSSMPVPPTLPPNLTKYVPKPSRPQVAARPTLPAFSTLPKIAAPEPPKPRPVVREMDTQMNTNNRPPESAPPMRIVPPTPQLIPMPVVDKDALKRYGKLIHKVQSIDETDLAHILELLELADKHRFSLAEIIHELKDNS